MSRVQDVVWVKKTKFHLFGTEKSSKISKVNNCIQQLKFDYKFL
jgi:hypothetical protein